MAADISGLLDILDNSAVLMQSITWALVVSSSFSMLLGRGNGIPIRKWCMYATYTYTCVSCMHYICSYMLPYKWKCMFVSNICYHIHWYTWICSQKQNSTYICLVTYVNTYVNIYGLKTTYIFLVSYVSLYYVRLPIYTTQGGPKKLDHFWEFITLQQLVLEMRVICQNLANFI